MEGMEQDMGMVAMEEGTGDMEDTEEAMDNLGLQHL